MSEKYKDKEWLEKKYHDERLSQREIAELCDVTGATIHRWMENLNVESRTKSEANSGKYAPRWGETLEFTEEHKENMSKCRMGEKHHFYGKSHSQITKAKMSRSHKQREQKESQLQNLYDYHERLKNEGLTEEHKEALREAFPTGEDHWAWRGGYSVYTSKKWKDVSSKARERAGHECEHPKCSKGPDELGKALDVHHIVPARHFEDTKEAHDLENLIALCPSHHSEMDRQLQLIEKRAEA